MIKNKKLKTFDYTEDGRKCKYRNKAVKELSTVAIGSAVHFERKKGGIEASLTMKNKCYTPTEIIAYGLQLGIDRAVKSGPVKITEVHEERKLEGIEHRRSVAAILAKRYKSVSPFLKSICFGMRKRPLTEKQIESVFEAVEQAKRRQNQIIRKENEKRKKAG